MIRGYYFIRHGQTDYNAQRIVQGSGIDSDLNSVGMMQAEQFYNHYQSIDFDLVITSGLKRSIQTVQRFIDKGIPHLIKTDIIEISWGVHEGKKGTPEMKSAYEHMVTEWAKGNLDARLPQAESARELIDRCTTFIDFLVNQNARKVLICTHGRTLRCLMTIMKKEDPPAMEQYEHDNTGLFLAHYQNGLFEFIRENDVSHREEINI